MRRANTTALCCAVSLAALSCAWAGGASAQDGAGPVEEVVVTASRVARTGFTAPTPTTVVSAAEFERRAPNNVADTLNELPAFRQTTSATSTTFTGSVGQAFADLRGLGSVRTLVLVNGRRHVPTATTGQVDLSLIPTILIDRTEVVTGGASAAWGSDAVAGVVNLILKNRLQGVQANVQVGQTDKGDDRSYNVGLAFGTAFQGDRGHFMIGGEATESKGVKEFGRRDWIKNRGAIGNAAFATNGQPATIYAEDNQLSTQTPGGIITGTANTPAANALKGIVFGDNGTLGRMQFGQVFGANMIGGSNTGLTNFEGFYLKTPVRRYNALAHIDYRLTDSLNAFTELSIAQSKVDFRSVVPKDAGSTAAPTIGATAPIPRGSLLVRTDNPFMPAALRAQMQAAGVTQVAIGRYNQDIGHLVTHAQNRTYRAVFGLEGDLGGSWKWDAYYQYGRNKTNTITDQGRRIEDLWVQAVDVVTNPATGQPICRSTLAAPGNGCVPFNVFGPNASSVAARQYVSTGGFVITEETQQVAAVNLSGDLFSVIAGPVSVAVGAEWRKDALTQAADAVAVAQRLQFGNITPTNGEVTVKEAYAEVVVPLAKDQGFAQSVDLSLAGRHTDYSTSGGVNTWKIGMTWTVDSQVRFRGALSRDIRAANVNELFSAAVQSPFIPSTNGGVAARQITGGNPDLTPERALTWTAGMVYQPEWLRGFRTSVDYYNIDMTDQISAVAAATIVTRCVQGFATYCGLITRDPASGLITDVRSQNQNLVGFKTSGFDIEATYARPLSAIFGDGAPGDFAIRALTTYTQHLITNDGFSEVDRAGQTNGGGLPKWQANISLTYSLARFSGTVQSRIIDGGLLAVLAVPGTATSANRYTVPTVAFWNLSASYDIIPRTSTDQLQVFAVVDNVLDQHPPFPLVQNPFYDTIGRAFRVGLRLRH